MQALPLVLLLALLGSGRAGPVGACLAGLAAAVPAALVSLPGRTALPGFLAGEVLRGLFLGAAAGRRGLGRAAVPCCGHRRCRGGGRVSGRAAPPGSLPWRCRWAPSSKASPASGWGRSSRFRRCGGWGWAAPWPGRWRCRRWCWCPGADWGRGRRSGRCHVGGAGAGGLDGRGLADRGLAAAAGPLLWSLSARAGLPVPARERLVQAAMLATWRRCCWPPGRPALRDGRHGRRGPVMAWALWRADPPRHLASRWGRGLPYLLLTGCLLAARLWPGAAGFRPFAEYPGLPLTHVAVVLGWSPAGCCCAGRAAVRRAAVALRRAARPALAMLLYVVLGRLLAGSGAAASLAAAAAAGLGPLAPLRSRRSRCCPASSPAAMSARTPR